MNPYESDYDYPTKPNKCYVLNCDDKRSRRHRFPKNLPNVFNAWLRNIKPPNYEKLSVLEIYRKYYVCDNHFTPDCFVPGTRRGLRKDAVPTVSVPGLQGTTGIMAEQDEVPSESSLAFEAVSTAFKAPEIGETITIEISSDETQVKCQKGDTSQFEAMPGSSSSSLMLAYQSIDKAALRQSIKKFSILSVYSCLVGF